MPTVEELYRNYGILADATETAGQVRCACGLQGLARPRACVAPPRRGGRAGVPSQGPLASVRRAAEAVLGVGFLRAAAARSGWK